jgi:hypothetical protein
VTARLAAVLGRPGAGAAAPPGVEAARFALALLEDTYELVAGMSGVSTVLAACPPSYAAQAARVGWPGTEVLSVADGDTVVVTRAVLELLAAAALGGGTVDAGTDDPDGDAAQDGGIRGTQDEGRQGGHDEGRQGAQDEGRQGAQDEGRQGAQDEGRQGAQDEGRQGGRPAAVGVVVCGDAPDLPPLLVAKLFAALDTADAAACPCEGGGLVAFGTRLPVPAWVLAAGAGLDTPAATARLRAAAPRRAFAVGPGWRRLRRPADVTRLDPGLEGWDVTRALLSGRRV